MNTNLIEITKDYFNKTEEVKNLMLQALGLKAKDDLLRFRSIMPMGVFYLNDMKHTYTFHGRGLRFSSEYGSGVPLSERNRECINIDMELGYDDLWCGIDTWMLFYFIKEYYPAVNEKFTNDVIVEEFNIGIKEKIMYKKHDLYYFK